MRSTIGEALRIFYAADTTPNASLSSQLWRNNLYLPLGDLGHEVTEFQFDLRETFRNLDPGIPQQKSHIAKNRPILSRELLRQIRAAHCRKPVSLFFSYFYDACVLPEAIDEIKDMGILTVNWYCNGSYQLHLVSEISPHYDWCLVPEKFRLEDYRAMGAHPIYCQEAANPAIYRPYALAQEFDVTFVGQAYGDRPAHIKNLLDNGIDVKVWGTGWDNYTNQAARPLHTALFQRLAHIGRKLSTPEGWRAVSRRIGGMFRGQVRGDSTTDANQEKYLLPDQVVGPPLSDTEMVKTFSRSRINLGFSSCGETHRQRERILQVRLRDFEIPMSGGFYIVEYMKELEEFYEIGKEIECYRSPDELVDKIKYYLSHEAEREAIRRAGRERCLRDHSWQRRFQDAFKEMGL